jgi:hypothetical protein
MLSEVQQVITVFPAAGEEKIHKSSFSRLEGKPKEYIEKYGLLRYAIKVI